MSRKPKKLEEIKEALDGRTLDEIEKIDICVLKEMRETMSDISDPRHESYVRHKLADIIMITFFAVLAGADEWLEIEVFAKKKKEWLKKFLELDNGVPICTLQ